MTKKSPQYEMEFDNRFRFQNINKKPARNDVEIAKSKPKDVEI